LAQLERGQAGAGVCLEQGEVDFVVEAHHLRRQDPLACQAAVDYEGDPSDLPVRARDDVGVGDEQAELLNAEGRACGVALDTRNLDQR
jgi:hypothetical protein